MKPGRNDLCACGSGKKYKKCCHVELAARSATQALQQPTQAAVHRKPSPQEINALATLFSEGRYTEAAAQAQTMTICFPLHGFGWKVSGAVLKKMGRSADALAAMQRAATLSPSDAEAHCNLGVILLELGRLAEAEASLRRALKIKPDYADAHISLGAVLYGAGLLDQAESSFRRALKIKPDHVGALNNLALLFSGQGKSMMAIKVVKQSLQIKETVEAKNIFVACAKRLRFTRDDGEIRLALVRAVTEPWGRPDDLVRIATDLVKSNPDIGGCIVRAVGAWPLRLAAEELFGPNGPTAVATDPLLCALLNSGLICDTELERFLTMARRTMLEAATGMVDPGAETATTLSFYIALARQCFINEYVFSFTDDEIQKASGLRDTLARALEADSLVPALLPITVAAYFPLHSIPLAKRLLDKQWSEEVAAMLEQQVREPEEELQERTGIPRLTSIEDEVSLQVQNQYEENPYPRWMKSAQVGKPKNVDEHLRQMFPLSSFEPHGKGGKIDILIAGCGTGQQSIGTAQQLDGAQVLAIDLSISSLSYAKRKTRELGLTSIEYAQADLLQLASLGRHFDIIESCGVLHHLADPLVGWQVLLSLLRPRGFMRLGFYSEMARRNIVKARAFIAKQNYGATANEIRRCRQDLIDLDRIEDFGTTLRTSDFFSISSCRDLLFHVQEHRMTLTGIDTFLRENNLTFLGFEIDADVLHAYKLRFPDDRAATNLGLWHVFENENPDVFIGMYNFWIQKAT